MTFPSDEYVPGLSRRIAAASEAVSEVVTNQLFLDHPHWKQLYSRRGRECCVEDVRFHLQFLAAAIESRSREAFADYMRWSERVLQSRSVPPDVLAPAFAEIGRQLQPYLAREEVAVVLSFLQHPVCTPPPGKLPANSTERAELHLARDLYLSAILAGRRAAALAVIEEALEHGIPLVDIYIDVLADCLQKVGKLWEMNQINVAQEHIATAITQFVIASIYPRVSPSGASHGSMVVTGVSGELHQIGANLVADIMEANGWDVQFLGSNLSTSSVLKAIESNSAQVVCISTTLLANLPAAADLIRAVRSQFKERTPRIVVGGAAFNIVPDFGQDIGPLAYVTDLRAALALLCN